MIGVVFNRSLAALGSSFLRRPSFDAAGVEIKLKFVLAV